jgi:phosphomannomutase
VIGGEGNGSVAVPEFSRAFDAFLMSGLILEAMAQGRQKASELLLQLPRYHIVKRQVYGEPHRCYRALESLERRADWRKGGRLDLTDGLRVDWTDGWIHLRASQTEPMVRIISESRSRPTAENRALNAVRALEQEL